MQVDTAIMQPNCEEGLRAGRAHCFNFQNSNTENTASFYPQFKSKLSIKSVNSIWHYFYEVPFRLESLTQRSINYKDTRMKSYKQNV